MFSRWRSRRSRKKSKKVPYEKRLKARLNASTPLATVLQDLVACYLSEANILFIADQWNHIIRACVFKGDGSFTEKIIAGMEQVTGHRDGHCSEALFNNPFAMAFHGPSQSLLVGSSDNGLSYRKGGCCIRLITLDGTVSTLCGNPYNTGYQEGVGPAALFSGIGGAAVIGDNLFVSDHANHCIRCVPLDGSRTRLVAGLPKTRFLFPGSPGCDQCLYFPLGLAAGKGGNLFVADSLNHLIRMITPAGRMITVAGCRQPGWRDGPWNQARFNEPCDVALDQRGNLLVADKNNCCIRSVDLETGTVTTLSKREKITCRNYRIVKPHKIHEVCVRGVAVDTQNGRVFSSHGDGTVRMLSCDGKRDEVLCGFPYADPYGMNAPFPSALVFM